MTGTKVTVNGIEVIRLLWFGCFGAYDAVVARLLTIGAISETLSAMQFLWTVYANMFRVAT